MNKNYELELYNETTSRLPRIAPDIASVALSFGIHFFILVFSRPGVRHTSFLVVTAVTHVFRVDLTIFVWTDYCPLRWLFKLY